MLWPIPLGASPSGYSVDWARPSVLPQKRQQQLPKDSANVLSYAPWGAHPGSRASAAETRAETDEGARADELSKDYHALRWDWAGPSVLRGRPSGAAPAVHAALSRASCATTDFPTDVAIKG